MTKVKICGLTEVEHVVAAVEHGADYIGFVFAPSKRHVTLQRAHELAKYIPSSVQKIGVFVNEDIQIIKEIAKIVPLDIIQLHGQEKPEMLEQLKEYTTIKAISVHSKEDLENASKYKSDFYLFDAPGIEFEGGSGHTFDWALLNDNGIAREKTFLAGGLNEGNIESAIEQIKPFAVDVSSGVETEGRKDSIKIAQFINRAKNGATIYDNY